MRLLRRTALALPLLCLALPASANAGGWATVELASPPGTLTAGTPWDVDLIVKQHGRTLLDDAAPSIVIRNDAGIERTFRARRTGHGRYSTRVVFPEAGTWNARIYDGWTDAVPHRLPTLSVSGAGAGGLRAEHAVAGGVMALLWVGLWLAVSGVPGRAWSARGGAGGLRGSRTAAG